jgi:hypothetical protein
LGEYWTSLHDTKTIFLDFQDQYQREAILEIICI